MRTRKFSPVYEPVLPMIETLKLINETLPRARDLDREIGRERTRIISRNLTEITGVNRSSGKFAERKAGIADEDRRSQNEDELIWFGAAAIESVDLSARWAALWTPLFNYAANLKRKYRPADFWGVQEEANALLANVRTSYVRGDRIETRFAAIQLRQKADELIRLCDAMPDYTRVG